MSLALAARVEPCPLSREVSICGPVVRREGISIASQKRVQVGLLYETNN
jgi:hypothetical protein